jgi:archaellum component FlaG (FlaF/FlaG flagellin family)
MILKGQGSTEYLMIFAAILVVGLVVAGLLSDTIKISGDVKKCKTKSFGSLEVLLQF